MRRFLSAPLIWNAISLYGTTIVTSVLGFGYWFVAARFAPIQAVGLASAVQAASQLTATVCVLGLNTVLVAELPRNREDARRLILSAGMLVAALTTVIAIAVGVGIRIGSGTLRPALMGLIGVPLFVLLTVSSTVLIVLDSASIGILRGNLQFLRNLAFAVAKICVLPATVALWPTHSGQQLEIAWLIGLCFSAFLIGRWLYRATEPSISGIFGLSYYWRRRNLVAGHYVLNLALAAPGFALPVLAATIVGATRNAGFTAAVLIAGFVNTIPYQLGTVLFAISPGDDVTLRKEVRKTLSLSFGVGAVAVPVVFASSKLVLGMFGDAYTPAAGALNLLALTVFPSTIIAHYVAITRIRGRMGRAAGWIAAGACTEIALAAVGGEISGTTGVAAGVLFALCVEASCFLPTVLRSWLRGGRPPRYADAESVGG